MTVDELKQKYSYLFKINDAKNLYNEMVKEEKKYAQLKELTFSSYVDTVKHNINYFDYLCYIPSAKEYFFDCQNKNTDKKSKEFKENKEIFKIFLRKMAEWFQQPVQIIDFTSGGYEGYYEEIQFTSGLRRKFSFTIPVAEKINEQNFRYANEGKLAFGEYLPDNFTHEIIETSYAFEDILKAFKETISEENAV